MKRWEIYLEILIEIILVVGLLFAIGYIFPKCLAFLWPLVLGWLIALIAHPIQKFLQKKLNVSKKLGSAVLVILVLALISGVIYLIGSKLAQEGGDFVRGVPEIYKEVSQNVEEIWNEEKDKLPKSIADKISGTAGKVVSEITSYLTSEKGVGYATSIAKSLTNGVIGIIVMFMSAYFFLVDWEHINNRFATVHAPELKKRLKVIKENILGAVGGYFIAQFKLMGIIFVLLFIGFLILRVDYVFVLAVLISLLDALPFLGVGTALIPWALYEFLAKEPSYAVGLLVLYVICLFTRQILQPKMVGQSVGLSSLDTLILMYIGMKIAGIIGFIIAVILGIIVKRLYELGMFDGSINRMRTRIEMLKHAE